MKQILLILAFLFVAVPVEATSQALLSAEIQAREIHVLKAEEGDTRIIMRFPLILAYMNALAATPDGAEMAAPFMTSEMVDGRAVYRLDSNAILEGYTLFSDFILQDFRFSVNGLPVEPEVPEYVLIDSGAAARSGAYIGTGFMASSGLLSLCVSEFPDRPKLEDTLVVISFFLPEVWPDDSLKIELLSPPFPAIKDAGFATHITDYRDGSAVILTSEGAHFGPVLLTGSQPGSFSHFLKKLRLSLLW